MVKSALTLCFLASIALFLCAQEARESVRTLKGHTGRVASVAFSPDGKALASASWDNTVGIWEVATGKLVRTLTAHTGWVQTAACSADGRMLATGAYDGTVRLWDTKTGIEQRKLVMTADFATICVAFSPDSKTLAVGTYNAGSGELWLFDPQTGKVQHRVAEQKASVFSLVFSPDGKTLVTVDYDPTLWDVPAGKLRRILAGHKWSLHTVALAPGGKTLACGGEEGTVELWDLATGKLARTLTGHRGFVESVAFSPDGKTVASAGGGTNDKTGKPVAELNLWDVQTGRLKRTLTGHSAAVYAVAFSPDGKTLATGSDDETVTLWDLNGEK